MTKAYISARVAVDNDVTISVEPVESNSICSSVLELRLPVGNIILIQRIREKISHRAVCRPALAKGIADITLDASWLVAQECPDRYILPQINGCCR